MELGEERISRVGKIAVVKSKKRAQALRKVEWQGQKQGSSLLGTGTKGDAYGHGIENVVPAIRDYCSHYAVADNWEAQAVKEHDSVTPIIRLRPAPEPEIRHAIRSKLAIREHVGSLEQAKAISRIAVEHHVTIDIHISIDAGKLGRAGLPFHNVQQAFRENRSLCRRDGQPGKDEQIPFYWGISPPYRHHASSVHSAKTTGKAKQMLRCSCAPITTIAMDCGFSSHSHFTYVFSKRMGMTPTSYREKFSLRRSFTCSLPAASLI